MPNVAEREIVDLQTDLSYQDGGIVSRVFLKQPTGSVTAFAFDVGQELSEHICPFDALLHVVEGQAQVTIGGIAHVVEYGQIIKLPAGAPHAVQAPRRFKMLLTMLRSAEK